MSPETRFIVGVVLFFVLCVSATGQQSMSEEQARHVSKLRNRLAHYDTGTKLDALLLDGSHHIGTLTEVGSDSFVLTVPSNSMPDSVNYLDVKRVQPTRKDYLARQLGKTAQDAPRVVVIALSAVAVITFLVLAVR